MKLTQCDRFKNHYYDSDKYSTCPHCAKLGLSVGGTDKVKKKGMIGRLFASESEQNISSSVPKDSGSDKTVMLTNAIYDEDENGEENITDQIKNVSISGNAEDIKTVAMYGFDEETEPVVGWLVSVSGEDKGMSYILHTGKNTIGRNGTGNEVNVSIDSDHSVSRGAQGLIIYEPKKNVFLLQSANGASLVYLNDELLMEYKEISAYDKITIGKTDLLFVPFCSEKFKWDNE